MDDFKRYLGTCGIPDNMLEAVATAYDAIMEAGRVNPADVLNGDGSVKLTDNGKPQNTDGKKEDKKSEKSLGWKKQDAEEKYSYTDGTALPYKNDDAPKEAAKGKTIEEKKKDAEEKYSYTDGMALPYKNAEPEFSHKISSKNGLIITDSKTGKSYTIGWAGKKSFTSTKEYYNAFIDKIANKLPDDVAERIDKNGVAKKIAEDAANRIGGYALKHRGQSNGSTSDKTRTMVAKADSAKKPDGVEAGNKEVAKRARELFGDENFKKAHPDDTYEAALKQASAEFRKANPGKGNGLQKAGQHGWDPSWSDEQKAHADVVRDALAKKRGIPAEQAAMKVSEYVQSKGFDALEKKYAAITKSVEERKAAKAEDKPSRNDTAKANAKKSDATVTKGMAKSQAATEDRVSQALAKIQADPKYKNMPPQNQLKLARQMAQEA